MWYSVTIFGEILPLWQKSKVFGSFIDGLFCLWKNVDPACVTLILFGNFVVANGPILNK